MATFPPMSLVVGPHMFAYEALFKQADAKGKGTIGAALAASFLKQSGLKESVLKQIWDLADPSGKGFLDKQGFFVALKLIAVVQNGKEASLTNIGLPVPLPDMGASGSVTAPPANSTSPWSVPTKEKAKYDLIFDGLGPINGLLPGDRVKPVLLNSKLPTDALGRIWDLSDMDSDGYLDREEFAVAMHLVYKALQKQPVPLVLPVEMVPPSKRKLLTSSSVSSPPHPPPSSAMKSSFSSDNNSDGVRGRQEWYVSPQAKAQYNELFEKTDSDKDGYVSGTEIKGIFLKSGLSQSVLAHIWSLCDMRGIGKLNRDQFALAMYFIQQKLKGVEPPAKLPPELIPQSVRRRSLVDGAVPAGMSLDYSSAGMKELDQLGNDIEKLKSEKLVLDDEKVKVEAEAKACADEMMSLRQELDTVIAAVKQLEAQKTEAQKRLSEIDAKRVGLEKVLKESNERFQEEQKQVLHLREQLTHQDDMDKTLEDNLKGKREELNQLRQQELELELKTEGGHSKLVQLAKLVHGTRVNISQVEYNITKLEEAQKNIAQTIGLYDSMLSDELTEDEASRIGSLAVTSPLALDLSISTLDAMSDIVQMTSSELDSLQDKLGVLPTEYEEVDESVEVECYFDGGGDAPLGADPFGEALASVEQASQETDAFFLLSVLMVDFDNIDVINVGIKQRIRGHQKPLQMPDHQPEDPFGTGTFAPPGFDDGKKSSLHPSDKKSGPPPPRPKSPVAPARPKSPAPPKRPKSPVPPRPKSPAPPGRPKSPAPAKQRKGPPPPRPPAPSKSPNPPHTDSSQDCFEGRTAPSLFADAENEYSDFNADAYSTDDTTPWIEK